MNIRQIFAVLRKRWVTIVLCVALGVAAATMGTLSSSKVYTASARVYVSFAGENSGGSISAASQIQNRLADYAMLATTPGVMQPVIDDLKLPTSPQGLASAITVQRPTGTNSLVITAHGSSPERVAELANRVALQVGTAIEELEKPPGASTSVLKVSLVDPAVEPTAPTSPQPTRNLALGMLVGLLVGLATAFVRDALDTTIKSVSDLERASGMAPMAVIWFDADAKTNPVLPLGSASAAAEDYRKLRTNLQYVDVDNPPKVITVTSAAAEEGKTSTAINIGLSLALAGSRVALLECDLRRPQMSSYLGITRVPGLSNVLAGQLPWQHALVSYRGLVQVLPEGHLAPNPTELLASAQMVRLISDMRRAFDFVILDSPPLLPVTDAAVLAAQSDGALLVIRHNRATRDSVGDALLALDSVDARVLGTVMTFMPRSRLSRYGRYRYRYDYRYQSSHDGPAASAEPHAVQRSQTRSR